MNFGDLRAGEFVYEFLFGKLLTRKITRILVDNTKGSIHLCFDGGGYIVVSPEDKIIFISSDCSFSSKVSELGIGDPRILKYRRPRKDEIKKR